MSKFKLNANGPTIRYSPTEQRLFRLLSDKPRNSAIICKLHYNKGTPPFNARKVVIGMLMSLKRKTRANHEKFKIMHTKRRGPIAMEFWIE